MKKHNFRKLKIWKKGMTIVSETYSIVKGFPKNEYYSLSNQMLRCAVSIPSNIAEGSSKSTQRHFCKYLDDSLGSAFECETQLIIAYNEKYILKDQYTDLLNSIQELQKMIRSFTKTIKSV